MRCNKRTGRKGVVGTTLRLTKTKDPEPVFLTASTTPTGRAQVMDLMRRQRVLCDVEIRVGSESFPAHRLVLLSMSPYFRAMFAGGLREVALPVVQIQGVCPSTMAAVVRFAYTGRVRIDQHNVCQLLPAATMFQVRRV